jgi:hypothetical protein
LGIEEPVPYVSSAYAVYSAAMKLKLVIPIDVAGKNKEERK